MEGIEMSFEKDRTDLVAGAARVYLCAKRFGRKMLSSMDYELTFEQSMILFIMDKHEGIRVRDIAEHSDRDSTTTSRMVAGLEKRGLVLRVPDPNDERQKLVYLTPLAKKRLDELKEMRDEFESGLYGDADRAKVVEAAELLHQIADRLENE